MKKLLLLICILGFSASSFASTTACSALCGYYDGDSVKLVKNPAVGATGLRSGAHAFGISMDLCETKVRRIDKNKQSVLMQQRVLTSNAGESSVVLVYATLVNSCKMMIQEQF